MKNKKIVVGITLVVFMCLTSCVVAGQLFFKGCLWWECAPARTFDVLDLGLPSTLFPADAQYSSMYYDRNAPLKVIDNGGQTIYWGSGNGLGIYFVYQYPTTGDAQEDYLRNRNWFFQDDNTKIPWDENVLTYDSSYADEFYSACGIIVANDYRCGMTAQYQEFFVFFNTTITEEMTHDDFQRVVTFIDQQMGKYIYGK
jgi:hypothetical protein